MLSQCLRPGEGATGQLEEGDGIGLDDIGWRAAGMPAALTDPELDGRDRGNAYLDAAAGVASSQQGAGGPGSGGHGRGIEFELAVRQHGSELAQVLQIGW